MDRPLNGSVEKKIHERSSDVGESVRALVIDEPPKHRAFLLLAMEGVIMGAVSVPQGNCVAALSAEVHKSLKIEWDMKSFVHGQLCVSRGGQLMISGNGEDEDGQKT